MADKNPRPGDAVVLGIPWQMSGYGKVPTFNNGMTPMIVIKRCKSGLYQCAVFGRRQTVSISKENLDIVNTIEAE